MEEMTLVLKQVTFCEPNKYVLTLEGKGGIQKSVECCIEEVDGVELIQCEPDVFITGEVRPRDIAALIKAMTQVNQ